MTTTCMVMTAQLVILFFISLAVRVQEGALFSFNLFINIFIVSLIQMHL